MILKNQEKKENNRLSPTMQSLNRPSKRPIRRIKVRSVSRVFAEEKHLWRLSRGCTAVRFSTRMLWMSLHSLLLIKV